MLMGRRRSYSKTSFRELITQGMVKSLPEVVREGEGESGVKSSVAI